MNDIHLNNINIEDYIFEVRGIEVTLSSKIEVNKCNDSIRKIRERV